MRIYRWRTRRDWKVCPTCFALDGSLWSDAVPPPPIPRHPRCRCRLEKVNPNSLDAAQLTLLGWRDDRTRNPASTPAQRSRLRRIALGAAILGVAITAEELGDMIERELDELRR